METQRHDVVSNGAQTRVHEPRGSMTKPVGDLLKELLHESQALVRGEVQLLRTELSEKVAEAQRGITSMLVGGAIAFAGALALLAAVVFGLAQVMPLWLSALVVGTALAIIGGLMIVGGKKKIEPQNLKPHRIIEEAKADGRFVKERVS